MYSSLFIFKSNKICWWQNQTYRWVVLSYYVVKKDSSFWVRTVIGTGKFSYTSAYLFYVVNVLELFNLVPNEMYFLQKWTCLCRNYGMWMMLEFIQNDFKNSLLPNRNNHLSHYQGKETNIRQNAHLQYFPRFCCQICRKSKRAITPNSNRPR